MGSAIKSKQISVPAIQLLDAICYSIKLQTVLERHKTKFTLPC